MDAIDFEDVSMVKHEATPLIIDIAKRFIALVRGIEPN
jgi:hypothetical protein